MTKSGHKCQYCSRLAEPSSAMRLFKTHAASGDRRAPFGSTKPVEEPATPPPAVLLRPVAKLSGQLEVPKTGQRISGRHNDGFTLGGRLKREVGMLGAVRCELLVGHEWPVRIAGRNASLITRVMGNILSSIGTSRDGARPVIERFLKLSRRRRSRSTCGLPLRW